MLLKVPEVCAHYPYLLTQTSFYSIFAHRQETCGALPLSAEELETMSLITHCESPKDAYAQLHHTFANSLGIIASESDDELWDIGDEDVQRVQALVVREFVHIVGSFTIAAALLVELGFDEKSYQFADFAIDLIGCGPEDVDGLKKIFSRFEELNPEQTQWRPHSWQREPELPETKPPLRRSRKESVATPSRHFYLIYPFNLNF